MKALVLFGLLSLASALHAQQPSAADYKSVQEAIDANPGKMIFVPAGDYVVDKKVRIGEKGGGLWGPGRIIQTNVNQPILEVEHAKGAEVRDLTLTRAEGKYNTTKEGLIVQDCRDVVVENIKVINNRSQATTLSLRECQGARVSHCLVRNYMILGVDDRTANPELGYAFNCIDGTGIGVVESHGVLVEGNRVIEDEFVPTQELKDKYKLGTFIKKNAKKGIITNQKMWDENYTEAWHQGSGIVINSPLTTEYTRVLGNHIENAAQGMDIHADHVIISQNIIVNSFMGMKAMHGSRNILITGNQFIKNDLWAIGLMPGAASTPENFDGGTIVANNIISDFGMGSAHWIWGDERSPIKFDTGQKPGNPPLVDVIVQGNLIQAVGAPHYKYAVIIPKGPEAPRGLHFSNNLFHPGTKGVANIELPQ